MATRYEILQLIREGKTAGQIMSRYPGQLAELKRVMSTRTFRRQLEAERELATVVAAHRTAAGACEFTQRLAELANGSNAETARKACLALLSEGMKLTRKAQAETDAAAQAKSTAADNDDRSKPELKAVVKPNACRGQRTSDKKTKKIAEKCRKTLKSIEY